MVLTLLEKRFKSLPFLSPMNTDFGQQHGLAGTKPTPPWAALAQASHFDVKTPLAGGIPLTPMPPAGGTFWQECRKVNRRGGLLAILPEVLPFVRRFDNSINPSSRSMDAPPFPLKQKNRFGNIAKPDCHVFSSMPGQGHPHSSHHRHTIRISRHSLETSQSAVRP